VGGDHIDYGWHYPHCTLTAVAPDLPFLTTAAMPEKSSTPTLERPTTGAAQAQNPESREDPKSARGATRGRRRAFSIFFIVLLAAAIAGLLYWLHTRQFESTDDAQVDAHLNPVSSRIDGTITDVFVDDNEIVKAGDPLVNLDPRDYTAALNQALAQLAQARSMVIAERTNVPITQVENTTNIATGEADVANAAAALAAAERDRDVAAAKVTESQANSTRAQADLARYKQLVGNDEVSRQEYDQIVATAQAQAATVVGNTAAFEAASRTVEQRRAQLTQAQTRLAQYQQTAPEQVAIRRATVISSQASAQSAEAQVEEARLKLSYCKIVAPIAGIVMKRSAEIGARIAAGQQLFMIAQSNDVWVTANYKETQLRRLKPGQRAVIHVDALKQDFAGVVESIGASTGSRANILPPENATGNYVKVVQRLPVRIRFKQNQEGLDRLRTGMSVEPRVRIGD
jgi:membrane fusion protein, multidrug efflux system